MDAFYIIQAKVSPLKKTKVKIIKRVLVKKTDKNFILLTKIISIDKINKVLDLFEDNENIRSFGYRAYTDDQSKIPELINMILRKVDNRAFDELTYLDKS